MAKRISEIKVDNIRKLKELGYPAIQIAKLVGVSKMTVYDYTRPGFYENRRIRSRDYYRRTLIVTGSTKENAVVLKGLHKRPYTGRCELCGKENTRFHYHHWDPDNPSMGIWICFVCHRLVELMDKVGSLGVTNLMSKYVQVKILIAKESAISKQSKQDLWALEEA